MLLFFVTVIIIDKKRIELRKAHDLQKSGRLAILLSQGPVPRMQ